MRRRDVLQVLAGAALAAPCGVAAQVTAKTFRLAALSAAGPGYMAATSPSVSVVIKALAERGYKLGQNLEFQPYGADMQVARLAQLASDITAVRRGDCCRLSSSGGVKRHRRSDGGWVRRGRSGGHRSRR